MATAEKLPEVAEDAEPDPVNLWYDRSSITADAMVTLLGQSPEDFELYAPETRFCDYIDGVVFMPSPVSDRHQFQANFLSYLLADFCEERDNQEVLTGPAVLRIGRFRKPEPDIFVRRKGRRRKPPALLVVEVLSRSTRSHDRGLKLEVYREAKIPEILLIDDRSHSLIVERLVRGGYVREQLEEGFFSSSSIPGFWFDVAWLWEDPLPKRRPCLEAILGGPPKPPKHRRR